MATTGGTTERSVTKERHSTKLSLQKEDPDTNKGLWTNHALLKGSLGCRTTMCFVEASIELRQGCSLGRRSRVEAAANVMTRLWLAIAS